jgi:hypothetical protein
MKPRQVNVFCYAVAGSTMPRARADVIAATPVVLRILFMSSRFM